MLPCCTSHPHNKIHFLSGVHTLPTLCLTKVSTGPRRIESVRTYALKGLTMWLEKLWYPLETANGTASSQWASSESTSIPLHPFLTNWAHQFRNGLNLTSAMSQVQSLLSFPHSCPATLPTMISPLHRPQTHPPEACPCFYNPYSKTCRVPRASQGWLLSPQHQLSTRTWWVHLLLTEWMGGWMKFLGWTFEATHNMATVSLFSLFSLCFPTHHPLTTHLSYSHTPIVSWCPSSGWSLLSFVEMQATLQSSSQTPPATWSVPQTQGDLFSYLNPHNILLSQATHLVFWTVIFWTPFLTLYCIINPLKTGTFTFSFLHHHNLADSCAMTHAHPKLGALLNWIKS